MKLAPFLFAATVAANVALVAAYFHGSSSVSDSSPAATAANSPIAAPPAGATAGAPSVAAETKLWASLNPGDFRALATRLRAAGFPPSVVRAVLTAQINASLRPRLQQLISTIEDNPFWSTDPGMGAVDPKARAASRELSAEHNRLLKEALGADFLADLPETSEPLRRRYGDLPREKIEKLERVEQDYGELQAEMTAAARGLMLPEDREKLALLEKEKRADLAAVLSPRELEDFLMRSSSTTARLRAALTSLNASEAEFRAIYQAQSAFDEKFNSRGIVGLAYRNADIMKEQQAAQAQANDQIKLALGDQRFAEYLRSGDREFQSISRFAQQAGLPATVAVQTYDLRENLSKESNRIAADPALTLEEKRTALQSLAQATRAQITTTLGAEAGRGYLQLAERWLSSLERGSSVTFTPGGMTTRDVSLPRPPGAAPGRPATTTRVIINGDLPPTP